MGRLARHRKHKACDTLGKRAGFIPEKEKARLAKLDEPPQEIMVSEESSTAAKGKGKGKKHVSKSTKANRNTAKSSDLPGKWKRILEQEERQKQREVEKKKNGAKTSSGDKLMNATKELLKEVGDDILNKKTSRMVSEKLEQLSTSLVSEELQKSHRVSEKRKKYLLMRKEKKLKKKEEIEEEEFNHNSRPPVVEKKDVVAFGEVAQDIPHFTVVPKSRMDRLKSMPVEKRMMELERMRTIEQYRRLKSLKFSNPLNQVANAVGRVEFENRMLL